MLHTRANPLSLIVDGVGRVADQMTKIAPNEVRYIKLGAGGAWEASCLDHGRIEWGSLNDPHHHAAGHDWEAAQAHYRARGRSAGTATGYVRELQDFHSPSDILWITFARDHLWWAFAEPGVVVMPGSSDGQASAYRRTIGPWRNTDLQGRSLTMTGLSSRLTKVAGYRQTICSIEAKDYLLRRINGEEDPGVAAARADRDTLIASTATLIQNLHWSDFEVLVGLLIDRAGWRRVSAIGGTMKDHDLIIEQPATGERASVQVKSSADQTTLNRYVEAFETSTVNDRLFFVCHSPRGRLEAAVGARPVHVWSGDRLASMAVGTGLVDWLIERAG